MAARRPPGPLRPHDPSRNAEPPPDPRRDLGARGEALAADHLERQGYRIVARNVRAGGVEMDLIARRGPWIVFVEVKTRRSVRFGSPLEAVDRRKQARLVRGARAWLAEHPGRRPRRARFDVVAVSLAADGRAEVAHLPAAFDAEP